MPGHTCKHCGKSYAASRDLTRHVRTHTGERPYKCSVCQKCFNQSDHLAQHMQTHTGERPFKCDTCGQRFTRKGGLIKHIKEHPIEKHIYCPECVVNRRWFTSESALDSHMRKHHCDFPSPQVTISTEVLPVGTVSCITHTSVTETGVVTALSRISSPAGSVIFTQTTNTNTTMVQTYPVVTATVTQSSGASVSCVEFPLNPVVDTEEPLNSLDEILEESSSGFSDWQLDNPDVPI